MKKLMGAMLGLTLAIGSSALFAQETKPADTKTATDASASKSKSTKKHHSKKKSTDAAAPAADATKK